MAPNLYFIIFDLIHPYVQVLYAQRTKLRAMHTLNFIIITFFTHTGQFINIVKETWCSWLTETISYLYFHSLPLQPTSHLKKSPSEIYLQNAPFCYLLLPTNIGKVASSSASKAMNIVFPVTSSLQAMGK
jgi:hypothetical protein